MKLSNVYDHPAHVAVLYAHLQERLREPGTNISHTKMPTIEEHKRFVESKPYAGWYFIESQPGQLAGVCYLTYQNEIGIHINRSDRRHGWAQKALKALMERHPREQYLANINPENEASKNLFKRLGFGLLQETYSLRSDHD